MILPHQALKSIISGKVPMIVSRDKPIQEEQIQPATVDCRLGSRAYRTRTSMIPKRGETVADLIKKYTMYDFELKSGSVKELEPNACYIIPLQEELRLSEGFCATFSPKSSTGRMDVFVRVLSDGNPCYDAVPAGYKGKLYLEIIPLSFLIGITADLELTQMRIKTENDHLSDRQLQIAHGRDGLVYTNTGKVIECPAVENDSLYFHVDLSERDIAGFQAKENTEKIDLSRKNHYDMEDFWMPIKKPKTGELVLVPGCFYLLSSKERVKIPPELAAEIAPYDTSSGEFRSHYAGFFDPGFGGQNGTNVVLEVRARDVPFRIYDGQPICRMVFEKMLETPDKLYGAGINSNYTGSGPSLSKHFKKTKW